jgi:hypothetical protein
MPPWLDLLFIEGWRAAFLKCAARTAESYPEFKLDDRTAARILSRIKPTRRWFCRNFARRTRLDPDCLDLCWLMLAADPANPLTYGFVGRLGDRVGDWQSAVGARPRQRVSRA